MAKANTKQQAGGPSNTDVTTSPAPDPPPQATEDAGQAPPPAASSNKKTDPPFIRLLRLAQSGGTDEDLKRAVCDNILENIAEDDILTTYNVLILHDDGPLNEHDADRIYTSVQTFEKTSLPILLVLHSSGGAISPAYFISKLCREYATAKFVIAVPRRAKSAATLICCGADEIHMGSLSELGPIDPQIAGMPALGLKYALQHLGDLVKANPASAEMFASYMAKTLKLPQLGYYERVAESAVQYAQLLLKSRVIKPNKGIADIANRLVYEYKDHGFAIDADEAESIFGKGIISRNSPEYKAANRIYESIGLCSCVIETYAKRQMYFIGSPADGCVLYTKAPR